MKIKKERIKFVIVLLFATLFVGCNFISKKYDLNIKKCYLRDIKIDTTHLTTGNIDYSGLFNYPLLQEKKRTNGIYDTTMYRTYGYDSSIIIGIEKHTYSKYPSTEYIAVYSDKYPIWIKNRKYEVGMVINDCKTSDIEIPCIIESGEKGFRYCYETAIKFKFVNGKIVSIIINFRAKTNHIHDVKIDSVKMQVAKTDYRPFFKGKTIQDSIIWDDYNEINVREVIFAGNSIRIFMSDGDTTQLFTKYINVSSNKYDVSLNEKHYYVGMTIGELGVLNPAIEEEYNAYIKNQKDDFFRGMYLGECFSTKIKIDGKEISYPCQGLKFQIKEGKIISILIDFRIDGDFI